MYQRIREVRKQAELSQKEFGESLGVSRDVMANIENNRVVPNDTFVQLLCKTFNINENWLRTGQGEMYLDDTERIIAELSQKYDMDDLNKEIITSLLDLPPDAQKTVAMYIKFVADDYKKRNGKE